MQKQNCFIVVTRTTGKFQSPPLEFHWGIWLRPLCETSIKNMTCFIWYLRKPSWVLRIALAHTLQGPSLALASFLIPAQVQDSSMQSSAHPLLLCSAVSTMGWVLVGVVCPIWEPKSCTKGYLRNFPLSGWDLTLQQLGKNTIRVFYLCLRSTKGLSPFFFLCFRSVPFLQPL